MLSNSGGVGEEQNKKILIGKSSLHQNYGKPEQIMLE